MGNSTDLTESVHLGFPRPTDPGLLNCLSRLSIEGLYTERYYLYLSVILYYYYILILYYIILLLLFCTAVLFLYRESGL